MLPSDNPSGVLSARTSDAPSAVPADARSVTPSAASGTASSLPDAEYRCPGESYTISPAVHRARLQAGYVACRDCVHRLDSPPRRRVNPGAPPARKSPLAEPLFYPEGVGGTLHNRFTPRVARQLAAAIACQLMEPSTECASRRVLLAHDGRWPAADLVAAVIEGLRWGGAEVCDLGPTTSAELVATLAEQSASGAVLIGNPPGARETVGLSIWDAHGIAWSQAGQLDALETTFRAGTDRTMRRAATTQHSRPVERYLHALSARAARLRPLRVVLAAESDVLSLQLRQVLADSGGTVLLLPESGQALVPDPAWQMACRGGLPLPAENRRLNRLIAAVRDERADLGAAIRADGEQITLVDAAGRVVPALELLTLLIAAARRENPTATVVVEEGVSADWVRRWSTPAGSLRTAPARREAMARRMVDCQAELGGTPAGSFWFGVGAVRGTMYAADALAALVRTMEAMSHPSQTLAEALARSLNPSSRRRV